ncbi:unnamed protein product [Prunus armeniaca]|uniref:Uncharacterized protein n=1 Tax=Prunus armeniaca TaxID=36596 RepID=A0A6J5XQZ5_PRUAR|nr:unnamed protein product [Prunus armeniaca]
MLASQFKMIVACLKCLFQGHNQKLLSPKCSLIWNKLCLDKIRRIQGCFRISFKISIYRCIGRYFNPWFKRLRGRQPSRISVFQLLENPYNSQQENVHNKRKWKDDLVQVNCPSFKETVDQDDNPPDIEEFIYIVQPASPQMKEGGQATIDDLQEINFGTADKP